MYFKMEVPRSKWSHLGAECVPGSLFFCRLGLKGVSWGFTRMYISISCSIGREGISLGSLFFYWTSSVSKPLFCCFVFPPGKLNSSAHPPHTRGSWSFSVLNLLSLSWVAAPLACENAPPGIRVFRVPRLFLQNPCRG